MLLYNKLTESVCTIYTCYCTTNLLRVCVQYICYCTTNLLRVCVQNVLCGTTNLLCVCKISHLFCGLYIYNHFDGFNFWRYFGYSESGKLTYNII